MMAWPLLRTVPFSNGSAQVGDGIYNTGTLTVENSTIAGNHVTAFGDGINNGGMLTVENSTITGNSAGDGGGIFNIGTVTLTHVTFQNNTPNDCMGCLGQL